MTKHKHNTTELIRVLAEELEYAHRNISDDKCAGAPQCHVCNLLAEAYDRPRITDRQALNAITNRLNSEVDEIGSWDSAADTLEFVANLLVNTGRKLK